MGELPVGLVVLYANRSARSSRVSVAYLPVFVMPSSWWAADYADAVSVLPVLVDDRLPVEACRVVAASAG